MRSRFFVATSTERRNKRLAITRERKEDLVAIYGELLGKYVKNGFVNYRGFKNEKDKLDIYLRVLEETDTKILYTNNLNLDI